jgi:hypothetical protein
MLDCGDCAQDAVSVSHLRRRDPRILWFLHLSLVDLCRCGALPKMSLLLHCDSVPLHSRVAWSGVLVAESFVAASLISNHPVMRSFLPRTMEGKGKSSDQRQLDRVSAGVWETLRRTSILKETEAELSEEEFYTPPGNPTQLSRDLSEGPVRFGGAHLYTPTRVERLLRLHDLITTQLLVPEPLWKCPEWYSSNSPYLRKTKWKLSTVFVPSSNGSPGRIFKVDQAQKNEDRISTSTSASPSTNMWIEF